MSDELHVQKNKDKHGQEETVAADIARVDALEATILARLGHGKVLAPGDTPAELLTTLRTSTEPEKRAAAARRLGRLEEQTAIPALEDALGDVSPIVRAAAAYALGEVGAYAHAEPLVAALHDTDRKVREASAWALGELNERIPVADLIALLPESSDEDVRANIARALGAYGESLLEPPRPSLTEEEKQVISRILDTLLHMLNDPDWQVREITAIALGKFGNYAPTAALQATVADESESEFVRRAAIRALGMQWEFVSYTTPRVTGTTETDEALQAANAEQHTRQVCRSRNVEFLKLEPVNLADTITTVAQALDNQWVPRNLLQMIMQGTISYSASAKYLEALVRTEYIRALINGKRLVINRAFLYNNPAIFRDYLPGHAGRAHFIELLRQGVIVPFLYNEQVPDEPPIYGTDPQGFPSWQRICQEVRMQCVRYSWGDQSEQERRAKELSRRFHNFAMGAATGELDIYLREIGLGLSSEAGNAFRKRLSQMTRKCAALIEKDKLATRNVLYEEFVTTGSNTAERKYDPSKPFAGEIKQLLDLAYNVSFADSLNGYLLTPADTASRLALQEWQSRQRAVAHLTAEDIGQMFRQHVFSLVQGGLYLRSMGLLTLQDVLIIRERPEWSDYIQSLEALLREPVLFEQHAATVYFNYIKLVALMTQLIEQRNALYGGTLLAPWDPSAKLVIEIGGTLLSVLWTAEGVFYEWSSEELRHVSTNGVAAFNVRLIIDDWSNTRGRSDLAACIDFMQGKVLDAVREWELIKKQIRSALWTRELSQRPVPVKVATLNEKD